MRLRTLILRSLRFHWRGHLGVLLGATVGSATLIGALVVGDSVRQSLRELALQRLGDIEFAVAPHDRFFRDGLRFDLGRALGHVDATVTAAITLAATASRQDGSARANRVQLLSLGPGLDQFLAWPPLTNFAADSVILNEALAAQLKVRPGDPVVLRVQKPAALPPETPISPRSESAVALRLRVHSILPAEALGNFSLSPNQLPPLNAFVRADTLQLHLGLEGRANVLLTSALRKPLPPDKRSEYVEAIHRLYLRLRRKFFAPRTDAANWAALTEKATTREALSYLSAALRQTWQLGDAELELRHLPEIRALELRTPRVFLEPPVVTAAEAAGQTVANAQGILTYLVNELRAGERATPYSMVTAMGAPVVPADMKDEEILINQWLAEDLQVGPGGEISLSYFLPDSASRLVEATKRFQVRAVLPMSGPSLDRALMPEFPGLAKAESTHDWDAAFPLVHKIRDQDEKYWKDYRGTPKAFVTLAAGKKMWANRFGELTAIRYPIPPNTNPADYLESVREKILRTFRPEE
ncbi:MAG: hypothetical protein DME25_17575, partial [Verrucomicrobia bacterium]